MKRAVYPGSFDPVTQGHLNIIERAADIFDEVVVCVMKNVDKQGLFSYGEREVLLKKATEHLDNVRIDISTGLLTDYMREEDIDTIIKGLRNSQDFQYEVDMARINKRIAPDTDTAFLISDPQYTMISSSGVRELIAYNADLKGFVPECILPEIAEMVGKDQL